MDKKDNPIDKVHAVALYRSIEHGWASVLQYFGERDAEYHGSYVRISEPMELTFRPLADDTVIQNAIAALNAQEVKVRLECEKSLAQIREMKSNLLALTHQPEPQS